MKGWMYNQPQGLLSAEHFQIFYFSVVVNLTQFEQVGPHYPTQNLLNKQLFNCPLLWQSLSIFLFLSRYESLSQSSPFPPPTLPIWPLVKKFCWMTKSGSERLSCQASHEKLRLELTALFKYKANRKLLSVRFVLTWGLSKKATCLRGRVAKRPCGQN